MSFSRHASPALASAVALVAPGVDLGVVPSASLSEDDQKRVRLLVAGSLFGCEFVDENELEEFLDDDEGDAGYLRADLLNETMLPFDGVGADCFMMNEHLPEDTTMASFATLGDYDLASFEQQERYRQEEGLAPREYNGYLHHEMARWIDSRLVYGEISTALIEIEHRMYEIADDIVDERWPTRFAIGPIDGEEEATVGGVRIIKCDARMLPEDNAARSLLAHLVWFALIEHLSKEKWASSLEASGDWAWRVRVAGEVADDETIVFSGPGAIRKVRCGQWLEDLAALPDGSDAFASLFSEAEGEFRSMVAAALDMVERAFAEVGEPDALEGEERRRIARTILEEVLRAA